MPQSDGHGLCKSETLLWHLNVCGIELEGKWVGSDYISETAARRLKCQQSSTMCQYQLYKVLPTGICHMYVVDAISQ